MPYVNTAAHHVVFLSLFLFTAHGHGSYQTSVLDPHIISRLELFDGANVLQTINRTKTEVGSACLAHMLANPSTEIAEIYRRQRLIKFFAEHEQVRTEVRRLLAQFAPIEHRLLSLWKKNTIPTSIERLYPPQAVMKLISTEQLPQTLRIFRTCDDWAMGGLVLFALLHARSVAASGVWEQCTGSLDVFYAGAQIVTAGVAVPFTLYEWYRHRTFVKKAVAQVRKRVGPLRTAFKIFRQIAHCMGEKQRYSPALKLLIKITQQDDVGSLLAAQKLVQEIGHELVPMLVALGNLDAYAGLAELVVESPQNTYCYAQCVNSPEPVLEVQQCWSPVGGQTELTRVTIALILAQATGIAPAQSFVFTPFDRVCCSSPHNLEPGQRAFVLSTQAVVKEEISLWTTERRIWHAEHN